MSSFIAKYKLIIWISAIGTALLAACLLFMVAIQSGKSAAKENAVFVTEQKIIRSEAVTHYEC